MSTTFRPSDQIETLAADTTVTAAQSGTTFILDNSTGEAITLPTLAAGLHYRFIVGAAFATDNWTVTAAQIAGADAANINGVVTVNNTTILAASEDAINFVASAENIGDYVDVIADSGNSQWLVIGVGHASGAITLTT